MQGPYHKIRSWYHLKKKKKFVVITAHAFTFTYNTKTWQIYAWIYLWSWILTCDVKKRLQSRWTLTVYRVHRHRFWKATRNQRYTVWAAIKTIIISYLQISMNLYCASSDLMNCAIRAIRAPAPGCNTLPTGWKPTDFIVHTSSIMTQYIKNILSYLIQSKFNTKAPKCRCIMLMCM